MAEDPFAVLGIAPTLDLGAVKRAYFAALPRHPPHADPAGFARLRAAYDALQSPSARASLTLSAPLDLAALWASRAAEAELAAARAARVDCVERLRAQDRAERFASAMCALTLDEAVARVPR